MTSLLVHFMIKKSNSEVKRSCQAGGLYINDKRVDWESIQNFKELWQKESFFNTYLVVRFGKKNYSLIKLKTSWLYIISFEHIHCNIWTLLWFVHKSKRRFKIYFFQRINLLFLVFLMEFWWLLFKRFYNFQITLPLISAVFFLFI